MKEIFEFIADVGFPISAAIAAGWVVFLAMKFILASVLSAVQGLSDTIVRLDSRIKTMNHDILRADILVSQALGLRPDLSRITRLDGITDARKD